MARKRMIDPEMWEDEKFTRLSHLHRLLFIGLVSNADDYGKLRGAPAVVRANVFPADDIPLDEIEDGLVEIATLGMIVYWSNGGGDRYIQLTSWEKHQKVPHPTASRLPDPTPDDEHFMKVSRQAHETVVNGSCAKESKVKESKVKESKVKESKVKENSKPKGLEGTSQEQDKTTPKKPDRFRDDSFPVQAARRLFYEVVQKVWVKKKTPNWQKWASNIDQMITKDGFSEEDINAIIDYLIGLEMPTDKRDFSWKLVIQSTGKLRVKRDELLLATQRDLHHQPRASPGRGSSGAMDILNSIKG